MVCFEQLSGIRINYHKSVMTPINLDEEETHQMAKILCCKMESFPFKYLGVPLHHEKWWTRSLIELVDNPA
jgi:hypothetical protein